MTIPDVHQYQEPPADPDENDGRHYETTDLGNARRLVDDHGHDLRHVADWGKWIAWNGTHWELDVTGEVNRRAKTVAEAMLDEARRGADGQLFKWGLRSQSNAGINAMVNVASTEPAIPIRVTTLDADPWALNVINGTLDLRTGQLREHRRGDLITKALEVAYDPTAEAPVFKAFLERVLPSADLRLFLQRFVGYSLTGLTTEQVIVFALGVGANGKSTLMNALMHLLGDYAAPAPPRLLVMEKHSEHPTQVADLLGKRLVFASETQSDARLDEEQVKLLTGSDLLKARRMREDYWTFRPSHKLLLASNHKPRIVGTDHAIWRRIRMLPFEVVIPAAEQDHDLDAKLRNEAAGILRWAVDGCMDWGANGLPVPAQVVEATDAYRQEQDVVAQFIAEACITNPMVKVRSTDLYESYRTWSEVNGLRPYSQKSLSPMLSERGFAKEEDRTKRVWWIGIGLTNGSAGDGEAAL